MLLDRHKVKFWQKIVFSFMALLMVMFAIGIGGLSWLGCDSQQSATAQIDEDIATQRAAVDAAPDDHQAWTALGELYLERGGAQADSSAQQADWRRAVDAYTRADELLTGQKGKEAEQARLDVLQKLIDVHLQLLDYAAATKVYGEVTELTPKDAGAFFDMATVAVNAGDTDTALLAFNRFLELDPKSPEAPQVKAWIEENSPNASP